MASNSNPSSANSSSPGPNKSKTPSDPNPSSTNSPLRPKNPPMAASDSNPSSTNSSLRPLVYLESMDEVKVVFDRFDVNRDGLISSSELSAVLGALGSHASADEVNRMIAEMDTDKDGSVNLQEFADFCGRQIEDDGPADGMKELRDAFQLYDEDKNGFICATELHKVLNRLGEACTVEDCGKMIKYVDTDGDGKVSFEEFKKMMTYDSPN